MFNRFFASATPNIPKTYATALLAIGYAKVEAGDFPPAMDSSNPLDMTLFVFMCAAAVCAAGICIRQCFRGLPAC